MTIAEIEVTLTADQKIALDMLLSTLSEDRGEAIRKSIEGALKKSAKDAEKAAEKAAVDAMLANGIEWAQAVQDAGRDAADALGIVIPAKGIKRQIVLTRASDGSTMCTVEVPTPKVRVTGGTRATNGSGSRNSVTQVPGFQGFVLADGTEVKSAAKIVTALAVVSADTNAGRALAAFARDNRMAANAVKVNVNGTLVPLGDAVAEAFPVAPITPPAV